MVFDGAPYRILLLRFVLPVEAIAGQHFAIQLAHSQRL
jgi:hypothetical protein